MKKMGGRPRQGSVHVTSSGLPRQRSRAAFMIDQTELAAPSTFVGDRRVASLVARMPCAFVGIGKE
jgi:hypothetical protein